MSYRKGKWSDRLQAVVFVQTHKGMNDEDNGRDWKLVLCICMRKCIVRRMSYGFCVSYGFCSFVSVDTVAYQVRTILKMESI